jgi:hypothetical protein
MEIKRFNIVQTGKVLGILYGMLAIIMIPFILIGIFAGGKGGEGLAPMLIMVILYPVMGFIGGIIGAAFYNLAARWVGGLKIDLAQEAP